jgi:hypothetical protein
MSIDIATDEDQIEGLMVASTPAQLMTMGILSCITSLTQSGKVVISVIPDRHERRVTMDVRIVLSGARRVHKRLKRLDLSTIGKAPINMFRLPSSDSALFIATAWAKRLGGKLVIEATDVNTTTIRVEVRGRGRNRWPGKWATTSVENVNCRDLLHRHLASLGIIAREGGPPASPAGTESSQISQHKDADDLTIRDCPDGSVQVKFDAPDVDRIVRAPFTLKKVHQMLLWARTHKDRLEADAPGPC